METKKNQQQERKGSVTGLALKMVGEDGNAFNEKTFVMESFLSNRNTYRTPFTFFFT